MKTAVSGFTLLELLIVIALIGILIAILIPNLLGSRNKAVITGAQAYVRLCTNSMTKYALDNPGVSLVGLSCADSSIQNNIVPNYILSSSVQQDIDEQNYIAYVYKINGQSVDASIGLDLK